MIDKEIQKHHVYIDNIDKDVTLALRNALEFMQWDKYIHKSTRVFIKPNFTFPYYVKGVTTNPKFLQCLLQVLKTKTDYVTIGESQGGNHSFTAEDAFQGHGMYEICQKVGARLLNLSTLPARLIKSVICGKEVEIPLPEMLLDEIDYFISVPVLKVHVMTNVSLSLKNSWGCVPDTMRALYHPNLSYKLALIAQVLKPKMVIVDGIYGLNKHGPMYGEPVKRNLILVSDNTVAADAMGARLMGFDPQKIKHLAIAEKAGLGSSKIENIVINQDWQPFVRKFWIKRTAIDRISFLPFNSTFIARLIFQSKFSSLIYRIAGLLRTSKEKEISIQMNHKVS